jgi:hypothetical protein
VGAEVVHGEAWRWSMVYELVFAGGMDGVPVDSEPSVSPPLRHWNLGRSTISSECCSLVSRSDLGLHDGCAYSPLLHFLTLIDSVAYL